MPSNWKGLEENDEEEEEEEEEEGGEDEVNEEDVGLEDELMRMALNRRASMDEGPAENTNAAAGSPTNVEVSCLQRRRMLLLLSSSSPIHSEFNSLSSCSWRFFSFFSFWQVGRVVMYLNNLCHSFIPTTSLYPPIPSLPPPPINPIPNVRRLKVSLPFSNQRGWMMRRRGRMRG
jgi:hypothetical protein